MKLIKLLFALGVLAHPIALQSYEIFSAMSSFVPNYKPQTRRKFAFGERF